MKKETKTKKTVQKKVKDGLVVNFTDINSIDDVYAALVQAKVRAGMPINKDELSSLIRSVVDSLIDDLFNWNNAVILADDGRLVKLNMSLYKVKDIIKPKKKEGFFKRIWRKITGK